MRPAALLFDVMDTLVWDPFRLIPGALGMELQAFLDARNPGAWPAFERGEIDEATFAATYFRDGRLLDMTYLRQVLRGGYRYLEGVEALLGELRAAGHQVHALSNYPPWYEMIEEELRLSRFLEWTFVSCRTGVRKPDADAYRGAARTLGLEPGACLFVDDRELNCEGARTVGMPAVRFRDSAQLRADLVARGCL